MNFVYLIQGAADRLAALPLPPDATIYALAYDRDTQISGAKLTIYDPRCTWAQGRNQLIEIASKAEPDADYFIFLDDDVEFVRGSFADFERCVETTRPKVAVPIVPRVREKKAVMDCAVQAIVMLDEQFVALHRSTLGTPAVCPLVTTYDAKSWWIACLLFEYYTQKNFGRDCHQYNTIEIENRGHTGVTGGTLYTIGQENDRRECIADYFKSRGERYDPTILWFRKQSPKSWSERFWRKYGRYFRRRFAPLRGFQARGCTVEVKT